jgi:hypothetical protein
MDQDFFRAEEGEIIAGRPGVAADSGLNTSTSTSSQPIFSGRDDYPVDRAFATAHRSFLSRYDLVTVNTWKESPRCTPNNGNKSSSNAPEHAAESTSPHQAMSRN